MILIRAKRWQDKFLVKLYTKRTFHHFMNIKFDNLRFRYSPFRLYSYGEYKAEDQEQMLAQLDKKVSDVYTKTIGPNDANIP